MMLSESSMKYIFKHIKDQEDNIPDEIDNKNSRPEDTFRSAEEHSNK